MKRQEKHQQATSPGGSGLKVPGEETGGAGPGQDRLSLIGEGYRVHTTGLTHGEDGFPTQNPDAVTRNLSRLFNKLDHHRDIIDSWQDLYCDDAEVLVVALGVSARAAQRAVAIARERGVKAGLFRPITLNPFPFGACRALADSLPAGAPVLTVEMNMGQMVVDVRAAMAGSRPVEFFGTAGGIVDGGGTAGVPRSGVFFGSAVITGVTSCTGSIVMPSFGLGSTT